MAVTSAAPRDDELSEEEYRQFALGDPQGQWELRHGRLRGKPPMSVEHGGLMFELAHLLRLQLDPIEFLLRTSHARLRLSAKSYYVPDIVVLPVELECVLS